MSKVSGKRASETQVKNVPEPEFTNTWRPYSHKQILNALALAVKKVGVSVVQKTYSLAQEGLRMVGIWDLDLKNDDGSMGFSLGFRNAMDKSASYGVTAGSHVFACANMMLSGDFLTFRRHTGKLDINELRDISAKALDQALVKIDHLCKWQQGLHGILIPDDLTVKAFTYDLFDQQILNGGKFSLFKTALAEEKEIDHGYEGTSLYQLHGAATRCMREQSLIQIARQTPLLENLCNEYTERLAA